MKFEIYGKEFKEIIDRISGIVPKKTSLNILETVKIIAKDQTLTFQATNTDDFGIIQTYAFVYEDGAVWVYLSDLKKILGISDDVIVTANDGKFEVRGHKKSYEIPCHDNFDEYWFEFPNIKNNDIMCRQHDDEFLTYLSRLNCMRSNNFANKMMTAFCIDLGRQKIAVLDGYRIGIANLVGGMFAPNCRRLIVNGFLYNGLKSLIGKIRVRDYIEIYADDKYAKFVGKDWTYITKLVEGTYFDYEKIINSCKENYDYVYTFNRKELGDIAKEYEKIVNPKNKTPMLIYNNNGNVATGIHVENYKTSDILESAHSEIGMGNEWYVGIDPEYISDACNMFDADVKAIGKYSYKTPIMFMNDTYEALILPINISDESVMFIKKQVA